MNACAKFGTNLPAIYSWDALYLESHQLCNACICNCQRKRILKYLKMVTYPLFPLTHMCVFPLIANAVLVNFPCCIAYTLIKAGIVGATLI